jgi:hypothetical protein
MISMGEFWIQFVPALFDGDKSNVGISFVLERSIESQLKRDLGNKRCNENGKRGGIDATSRH